MPDKIDEAPDRLMIGGRKVLLKYAPNQKSACQNCVFHTNDIEHCSLRETDYFGVVCPCERFGNFSSYPYFVLDNSNAKDSTIPNRIYAKNGYGKVEFIRTDKVMEILKSRQEQTLNMNPVIYVHDMLIYDELIKQIEALK